MVYGIYNELWVYKPTYNWGAPHSMIAFAHHLFLGESRCFANHPYVAIERF